MAMTREQVAKRKKEIGDALAFPTGSTWSAAAQGMTYRQWLLGQAVAGCAGAHDSVSIADRLLQHLAEQEG